MSLFKISSLAVALGLLAGCGTVNNTLAEKPKL